MKSARLRSGKALSRLGFGCSSYWAKPGFPEAQALLALRTAADNGITYFDTGPSYAAGLAEHRLGLFLQDADPLHQKFVVSSKFGTHTDEQGQLYKDFAPKAVEASVDASLVRLGLKQLDMLFLHAPETAQLNSSLMDELERLKSLGKIDQVGVWSTDPAVVEHSLTLPIEVNMVQFNVTDQAIAPLLPKLAAAHRLVINGTALSQGVFSLKAVLPTNKKRAWYFARLLKNNPKFLLDYLSLRSAARDAGLSPLEYSMNVWAANEFIACGIFGSTSPANIAANCNAMVRLDELNSGRRVQ